MSICRLRNSFQMSIYRLRHFLSIVNIDLDSDLRLSPQTKSLDSVFKLSPQTLSLDSFLRLSPQTQNGKENSNFSCQLSQIFFSNHSTFTTFPFHILPNSCHTIFYYFLQYSTIFYHILRYYITIYSTLYSTIFFTIFYNGTLVHSLSPSKYSAQIQSSDMVFNPYSTPIICYFTHIPSIFDSISFIGFLKSNITIETRA